SVERSVRTDNVICVSPGCAYGLDEPNTGPFCLMRTQPCAHALGVGIRAATNAAAEMKRNVFTHNLQRGGGKAAMLSKGVRRVNSTNLVGSRLIGLVTDQSRACDVDDLLAEGDIASAVLPPEANAIRRQENVVGERCVASIPGNGVREPVA